MSPRNIEFRPIPEASPVHFPWQTALSNAFPSFHKVKKLPFKYFGVILNGKKIHIKHFEAVLNG